MKMKTNRVLAVLLAMVMVFTLVPITAFATGDVAIDETNFPDANFRNYVNGFDTDDNGVLSEDEIAAVGSISVSYVGSLKGIEYFTALKTLYCSGNNLTELDLSKNTALVTLSCKNNQLTNLNVKGCTALKYLSCDGNKLTELDLSGSVALKDVYCYDNELVSLNASGCKDLERLGCYDNQLTSLDVSDSTALTVLFCHSNQLTSLDISGCKKLKRLECYDNQLMSLDVSNNTALTELFCYRNQLTSLTMGNHTDLIYLWCYRNQLTSLDVSECTALKSLSCSGNICAIVVDEITDTFDLSTLPEGFDVSKASNWQGGKVSGNTLTIVEPLKPFAELDSETIKEIEEENGYTGIAEWEVVTYDYDLGNGEKETFALQITYTPHVYGDWQYDAENHWKECACGAKGETTVHEFETVNAKEPTEFTAGYTGDKVCKTCGYTQTGEEIPAIGIDLELSEVIKDLQNMAEQIDPEDIKDAVDKIKPVVDKIIDFVGTLLDNEVTTPTDPSAPEDDTTVTPDKDNSTQTPDEDALSGSESDVPNTGVASGVIAFATLSVAAAAAFVSKKKKD